MWRVLIETKQKEQNQANIRSAAAHCNIRNKKVAEWREQAHTEALQHLGDKLGTWAERSHPNIIIKADTEDFIEHFRNAVNKFARFAALFLPEVKFIQVKNN